MESPAIGLLCLACSLFSGGASYVLFHSPSEPPKTGLPAKAPVDDGRIAHLENQIVALRDEVAELRELPTPAPQPEPRSEPRSSPKAQPEGPGEDLNSNKAGGESVSEIEKSEAATREWAVRSLGVAERDVRFDAAMELQELARSGDEAATQALLNALKSENPDEREAALLGIGMSEMAEFMPALRGMLADPDAGVREVLAETLGDMPAEEAGPVLMQMLTDTEPDVLREVAEVLGELEYTAAAADLLPLTRHAHEAVAIEASIAMRKLGDSGPAEFWVPTLGARINNTDLASRLDAVDALGRLEVESARPYLRQALNDSDKWVRRNAASGLEALDD
jgi:hypothetical protein